MWPVIVGGGLLVGGWLWSKYGKHPLDPHLAGAMPGKPSTLAYDPHNLQGTIDVKDATKPLNWSPPTPIGTTPSGHPIIVPNPMVQGKTTLMSTVAQNSPAAPHSHNLYDYLTAHGSDGSQTYKALVTAFQGAVNSDPNMVHLIWKPLLLTGVYDMPTALAMTFLMGDPIPADPQGQQYVTLDFGRLSDPGIIPMTIMDANMLASYLKLHGNDGSATLHTLASQFQHDFNTDLKFYGPANKSIPDKAKPPMMRTRIKEDGDVGTTTTKILSGLMLQDFSKLSHVGTTL